jgi:micrococcal nuclease
LVKIIDFLRHPGKLGRSWRSQVGKTPWPRLVALIAVAAALWLAGELHPAGAAGGGTVALLRGGGSAMASNGRLVTTSVGSGAAGAGGGFVLCARSRRPNCVVDGDTIRVGGIKIRLEDIDAPEVFSPRCPSELARGNRATARLLELINEGPFELVRTGTRDRDRYGRELRTLERDGRSLGAILVAEGLARPWDGARHPWCG